MKKNNSIQPSDRNFAVWHKLIFPLFRTAIRSGYISLEVSGLENIPQNEHVIYVANHSSWLALDGLLIPYALHKTLDEEHLPYGIIHDVLFKLPMLNKFFSNCGAIPVSWVRDLSKIPKAIGSLGIFPEGDAGNSKPFWEAYRMRKWKRGFVKLALNRKQRVVPIAIQGLEESMPVAFTISFLKSRFGTYAGYPLFPFPLPSKYKLTVCKPIDLSDRNLNSESNTEALDQIAEEIRLVVQKKLDQETRNRPLARLSHLISHLSDLRSSGPSRQKSGTTLLTYN